MVYGNDEAYEYTRQIKELSGHTVLQAYMFHEKPLIHAQEVIRRGALDFDALPMAKIQTILDLGCGTGEFIYSLAQLMPDTYCAGINLFPSQTSMLPSSDVALINGDIEDPYVYDKLAMDHVDAFFCNYTAGHVSLPRVLSNIQKFCRGRDKQSEFYRTLFYMWDLAPANAWAPKEILGGYKVREPREVMHMLRDAGFVGDAHLYPDARLNPAFKALMSESDLKRFQRDYVAVFYMMGFRGEENASITG